ncbi:MAG: VPLPA-CTERM sorting domain-containing protein [Gammaproteobacteria bacterium]|nr:VPLPA-CTERM sorting domain-containing protein [Gammaproteobacteria bacterium]
MAVGVGFSREPTGPSSIFRSGKPIHCGSAALASTAAAIGAYTIDFEEFTVGDTGPVLSGDFEVSGFGTPGFGCQFGPPSCVNGAIITGQAFEISGAEEPFSGTEIRISVSRQDNQAFAIYDMDLSGFSFIEGETAAGDTIFGTVTDFGAGDWLNVVSISAWTSAPPTGSLILWGEVDNIVVGAAVAIPAAVWLFGSGLVGLGFIRRRKS